LTTTRSTRSRPEHPRQTTRLSGEYEYPASRSLIYGGGSVEQLRSLIGPGSGSRAFAVVSSHLGTIRERLEELLGRRLVGVFDAPAMHVPRQSILAAAAAARAARADTVVSVGGGSVIDCAKGVALSLAYGFTQPADLDVHAVRFERGVPRVPVVERDLVRHISVPTTLSGAESTHLFGSTDPVSLAKYVYASPRFAVETIILDPEMTRGTPARLWVASGMRAVDHAVEGILSRRHMPLHDATGAEGLRILSARLVASAADPDDLDARLDCQLAAWLTIFAAGAVGTGLSHAIGHQLAPRFGMLHGETSAVILPHVLDYNREATRDRATRVAAALGVDVAGLSLEQTGEEAVHALRRLVASIARFGIPQTLRAAGVDREGLGGVADHVMLDPTLATNPKPVSRKDVMAILDAAWTGETNGSPAHTNPQQ
jgi:alcohol dehydrogenase class IV